MKKGRRFSIAAATALLLVLILHASAFSQQDSPAQPADGQEAAASAGTDAAGPGQVAMPAPGTGSAAPVSEVPDVYTIKQGDTLWDISNMFLKDPFLWPLIWKLNAYITNPDLIYPGNTLRIPGIETIERAMEMPAQPPKEEAPVRAAKKEAPVAREAPTELPFQGRRTIQTEQPVEEEITESRLILPEDVAPPLIDKYGMISAGFVADEDGTGDRVVGGIEPKSIFGFDDLILIRLRSPDEVAIGDKLLLYAPYRNVIHPVTGRNYGKLTKILGIVQITAIEPSGIATGRITISFDAVERGHLATTYIEPSLIYPNGEPIEKSIMGHILEVRDTRTVNGQTDIVYLDRGLLDGVEVGDRFTVYLEPKVKGYPNKVIGEVQVFLVKDRTATAVVKKSTDAMARGDRITHTR